MEKVMSPIWWTNNKQTKKERCRASQSMDGLRWAIDNCISGCRSVPVWINLFKFYRTRVKSKKRARPRTNAVFRDCAAAARSPLRAVLCRGRCLLRGTLSSLVQADKHLIGHCPSGEQALLSLAPTPPRPAPPPRRWRLFPNPTQLTPIQFQGPAPFPWKCLSHLISKF